MFGRMKSKHYKRIAILPLRTQYGDGQAAADALTTEFMKAYSVAAGPELP